MYNFMTDARIHTEMQGHFNILKKRKKEKKKNYKSPQEENARPFINRPERKNERCLFTDSGAFTKCKSSIANVRRFK